MRMFLRARAVAAGLSAVAAAVISQSALAQDCSTALPAGVPHVVVKGSTAAKPLIAAVAGALYGSDPAKNLILLYSSGGSCTGVDAVVSGALVTGTVNYWSPTSSADGDSCLIADPDGGQGVPGDIGASDVFPQSCTGHENDTPSSNTWEDFPSLVQTMVFIVPKLSQEVSISAEAGYFTLGMTTKTVAPWTDKNFIFLRNASSGTQTMISKAVGLLPTDPLNKSIDSGSAGAVVNNVKGASNVQAALGIVSTAESDPARSDVRVLAFQPKGQTCAFWPDSSVTSFDKRNVRDGSYPIWGPLHLITKVTNDVPTNPNAKKLIDWFTGAADPPGGPTQLIDLEIANYTVPECAMNVKRTSELGPTQPMPSTQASCRCYFEHKVPMAGALPSDCMTCSTDDDCADAGINTHCRYGYCEAR